MSKMTAENSAVTRLATDVFAPAAFESLFWRPRYLIDSPVVTHLPLLFWICAALRPSNAAVVGAGDGVAHFALCQAMDRFNGQGQCSGYGFWKEAASGGMASIIPPKLTTHQGILYEEISHLVPSQDPDAVADGLGEGALDLLWLDLTATPEGLGLRADLFSRALNRTGVMFIHGIRRISDEGADGAALKRLIKSKRCVRFDDEEGLLLVALDGDLPTRIEALLTTAKSAALAPEVERVFRRVGQGLISSVRADDAMDSKQNAEKKAAELSAARDRAEGALKEINSAYELRNKKFAEVQSDLFDARLIAAELKAQIAQVQEDHSSFLAAQVRTSLEAQQQLEAARAEANDLRDQLKVAEDGRVALEAAQEAALAKAESMKVSLKESLTSERSVRFSETATLTRMIEALKAERERKKRPLEVFLIKRLVRSEKKINKYHRGRVAFFSDASSVAARFYFRMRPGP